MIEFAVALSSAVGAYTLEREKARGELTAEAALREQERWEDENLLTAMTADQAERFLAERRRRKERREDIARQERQHRELLAAEREKAAAIREAGHRSNSGFLRGLIWGEILGGGR